MSRRYQERILCLRHGDRVRVAIITGSFLPSVNGVTGASGVRELLTVQRPVLRAAARRRAEQFTWSAAVDGMLQALRAS